jgi:hypothetical protein
MQTIAHRNDPRERGDRAWEGEWEKNYFRFITLS